MCLDLHQYYDTQKARSGNAQGQKDAPITPNTRKTAIISVKFFSLLPSHMISSKRAMNATLPPETQDPPEAANVLPVDVERAFQDIVQYYKVTTPHPHCNLLRKKLQKPKNKEVPQLSGGSQ